MAITTQKPPSDLDFSQNIQRSYNDVNGTISIDGFLTGLVGRRVDVAISTTNSSNDTQTFTFSENGTNLYTIQLVFTDSSYAQLLYAVRTA